MSSATVHAKLDRLRQVIAGMESAVVAYSGGVDSTLVLRIAHEQLGHRALGVTAVSPTFPSLELEAAKRVAEDIGARHELVETDQLAMAEFTKNDASRCFYCKTDLYRLLGSLRGSWQAAHMLDGTNVDDLGDDRPGLAAARQWGVRSPLLEADLHKSEIRTIAKDLGLPNWDKPAAACLSSRIPRGVVITRENLSRVERAEALLAHEGFRHCRVRAHGEMARIEVDGDDLVRIVEAGCRLRLSKGLKQLGFHFITVDLEGYRPGGIGLG